KCRVREQTRPRLRAQLGGDAAQYCQPFRRDSTKGDGIAATLVEKHSAACRQGRTRPSHDQQQSLSSALPPGCSEALERLPSASCIESLQQDIHGTLAAGPEPEQKVIGTCQVVARQACL